MKTGRQLRATHGLTLVELLVVVALIGILAGLLLPAVQAAREAGRRLQCANNVRQIGLGLHRFHDTHRSFPPGGISGGGSAAAVATRAKLGIPPGVSHGWVVFLLPFLDQQAIDDQYRRDRDWRDATNQRARETHIPILQCPGSPGQPRWDGFTESPYGRVVAAAIDYGVDNGINPALYSLSLIDRASADHPHGVMRVDELVNAAEIRDGLSHTMWICEDAGRPLRYVAGLKLDAGRTSGASWTDRDNEFLTHGFSISGDSSPGPCAVNCTNNNEIYAFHPAGAHCLFGDASVRLLSTELDIRVVACWLTRAASDIAADR